MHLLSTDVTTGLETINILVQKLAQKPRLIKNPPVGKYLKFLFGETGCSVVIFFFFFFFARGELDFTFIVATLCIFKF